MSAGQKDPAVPERDMHRMSVLTSCTTFSKRVWEAVVQQMDKGLAVSGTCAMMRQMEICGQTYNLMYYFFMSGERLSKR